MAICSMLKATLHIVPVNRDYDVNEEATNYGIERTECYSHYDTTNQ